MVFDAPLPSQQTPNISAHGAAEPSTSLDSGESTVDLPRGTELSAPWPGRYQLLNNFRHSNWRDDRRKVHTALIDFYGHCNRTARFGTCGYGGFVLRSKANPMSFKVVGFTCRDRFCQPCAQDRTNSIRLNVAPLLGNRHHRFLTLTQRASGRPLRLQIDDLLSNFRRLRQSKLWTSTVTGGVALLELKYNAKRQHWHPHLHCIIHGRFIPQGELSDLWQRITEDSFIVDIRLIRKADDALGHIVKYATKRIAAEIVADPERLTEAIGALAGRKLCIGFGDWATVAFTKAPCDEQWEYVCQLSELSVLADQGNERAVAALDAIDRKYHAEHRPNRGPPGPLSVFEPVE